MSRKEKVKELMEAMRLMEPLVEMTMKATGCDSEFAEKHPLDYAKMVGIYKDAVEKFLLDSIDKAIETEETMQKIIDMHNTEEYKAYEEATDFIAKSGNPFMIGIGIAQDERVPKSFLRYVHNKASSQASRMPHIQQTGPGMGRIEVKSPEQLMDILEKLKEIGAEPVGGSSDKLMEMLSDLKQGQRSPEDDLGDNIKELEKILDGNEENPDCEQCDATNCANREKPPKGTLVN